MNEIKEFLTSLVQIAAAPSLSSFRHAIDVENKRAQGFDPVTAADRDTEKALRHAIKSRFPEHGIIGEEGENHQAAARYRWVIDPIDGTRAYICGLPTWATLIAFCDEDRPQWGVMSQPVVGEYFIGGDGESECVTRSGRTRLKSSTKSTLGEARLFATSPDMFNEEEASRFHALSQRTQLTRYGVDSYAYCLLAAGFVDFVAEADLNFYDIAALIPIIESAGGIVTDWNGAPVSGGARVLAAANASLHEQALALLAD